MDLLKNMMTDGVTFQIRRKVSKARDKNLTSEYREFLRKEYFNGSIIMAGYPKSGNTLFRFVYFNLLNQIEPFQEGPLNFDQLNEIQFHTVEGKDMGKPSYNALPMMIRSHLNHLDSFNFLRLVYVYRNPLDCMISMHYFKEVYRTWRKEKKTFKESLRTYLPEWCYHMKSYEKEADFILSYEEMFRHPQKSFHHLFTKMGLEFTDDQLEKAVELSTFKNIRKIEDEHGSGTMTSAKKHNSTFGGKFTRSGKIGQWKEYYDQDDLDYAFEMIRKFNLDKTYKFTYV